MEFGTLSMFGVLVPVLAPTFFFPQPHNHYIRTGSAVVFVFVPAGVTSQWVAFARASLSSPPRRCIDNWGQIEFGGGGKSDLISKHQY